MRNSLLLISLLTLPSVAIAASFNDAANGAWDICDTWGTCPGAVEGTDYPGLTDSVVIDSHTVTMTGASAVKDISINPAGTLSVDAGLIGYWKFDEGAGTLVKDSTSNANHGTLTNSDSDEWITTVADDTRFTNPYALDFDGSDDYVDVGEPSANSDTLTISAWVQMDGDGTSNYIIFAIGDKDSNNNRTYLSLGEGTGTVSSESFLLARKQSGTVDRIAAVNANRSTVFDGNWHHVTVVLDSAYLFYLNGASQTTTMGLGSNDGGWSISDYDKAKIGESVSSSPFSQFDGRIDDIRIYNRALTASEITILAAGHESTGTLTVDGTWENNGGTFNAGFGKVIMTGSGGGTIKSGGDSFYDLDIEDPQEEGLVGYWKFDEGEDNTCSGGEDACDSSEYGNHGTITNGDSDEWVTTNTGTTAFYNPYAMDFDGSDDQVDIALNEPNATPLTLSAWFRMDSISFTGNIVGIEGENASAVNGFALVVVNGEVWALTQNTTNVQAESSVLNANQWYHGVAVFRSSTDREIYVDGVSAGTNTDSKTPDTTYIERMRIGQRANNEDDQNFSGSIDDVRIYNRALNGEEVLSLANGGYANVSLDAKLAGYWKFDEGSGTTAEDYSGFGNSGALTTMDDSDWVTTTQTLDYANPYALDFDGSSDVVTVPDSTSLSLTSAVTTALWYKTSFSSSGRMAGKPNTSNNDYVLGINVISEGTITFSSDGLSTAHTTSSTGGQNDNTWRHAAATFDGSNVRIYLNGVLDKTQSVTGSMNDGNQNIRIGSHTSGEFFFGLIDDVRIYSRALSATEIANLAGGGHRSTTFATETNLDINGQMGLYNGALDGNKAQITVGGDWDNYAGVYNFEAESSTVKLDGADQTFSGMANTFSTLIKEHSDEGSDDILTMVASGSYVFTKTFSARGVSSTNKVNLVSSDTTYNWNIWAENTNFKNLDVTNSTNLRTQTPIMAQDQTDGGSNNWWCFTGCTKGVGIFYIRF